MAKVYSPEIVGMSKLIDIAKLLFAHCDEFIIDDDGCVIMSRKGPSIKYSKISDVDTLNMIKPYAGYLISTEYFRPIINHFKKSKSIISFDSMIEVTTDDETVVGCEYVDKERRVILKQYLYEKEMPINEEINNFIYKDLTDEQITTIINKDDIVLDLDNAEISEILNFTDQYSMVSVNRALLINVNKCNIIKYGIVKYCDNTCTMLLIQGCKDIDIYTYFNYISVNY